jgi:hypothetical protein
MQFRITIGNWALGTLYVHTHVCVHIHAHTPAYVHKILIGFKQVDKQRNKCSILFLTVSKFATFMHKRAIKKPKALTFTNQ